MSKTIQLCLAQSESDIKLFWDTFNNYINELALHVSLVDDFDLDYFHSDEYRDAIEKLRIRTNNPLRKFIVKTEEAVIGFFMYVTYFDENGKCFLMEYYIEPQYRSLGYGSAVFFQAEKSIHEEGASYIELTPTNEANERFWTKLGFVKSTDMDEDNKFYYRKTLKESM
ncbi:GNAT family N-acetyltransferase [Fontibacillus sp. BL9]|uniref:GNAT family N-acetyltransferase n=1 Tax=Fontibacillus sp. BL9 TaxID=3389971 RepID=UPI00397D0728